MSDPLPVAVDAMGGDNAPESIVAGAVRARDELGIEVLLVGRPDLADRFDLGGLELLAANEVVAMSEDPARAIRTKKDSSLVRAAEAVRDGRAGAMVSAGNTGATMASALFRMGRTKGVARPAIATPIPVPGAGPTVLVDSGANSDCQPEWLRQFAIMGAVTARERFGLANPRVALLSIGEEDTKGNQLVKETRKLLGEPDWARSCGATYVGNCEGRDLMTDEVDVVVCDGFTGNVALKTLEGSLKFIVGKLMEVFGSSPEAAEAAGVVLPLLAPVATELDPDTTGGAGLVGVDGVCVISHGSSSETAIVNAVRVARELADRDLPGAVARAIRPG